MASPLADTRDPLDIMDRGRHARTPVLPASSWHCRVGMMIFRSDFTRVNVMSVDPESFLVPAVMFVATFIRSAFGFGEALVAVPLLALIIPIDQAAPLAVLASIVVAAFVVMQDWRQIHFRSAALLVATTLVGTPLGLLLLAGADEQVVKTILAVGIIAFSTYCLRRRRTLRLADDRLAWLFGFFAGVLGGAYGMNGPPLVIYGSMRGWSPQHFRATLQGYFLPASLLVLAGYALTGLVTTAVAGHLAASLPGIIAAILLGRVINRRLTGHAFLSVVHALLIAVGIVLLLQTDAGCFGMDRS